MREVVSGFGGAIPRLTEYGLPSHIAARATNCKMHSGEVRGIHSLSLVKDFGNPAIRTAFRIPFTPSDLWLGFTSLDAVVVRSLTVNDTFKRYYWHEPGGRVFYNTEARIAAGNAGANAPFWLGVPQPVGGTVGSITGGSGATTQRFYTYTFVSAYGEEGPPVVPFGPFTGFDNASWNLGALDTAPSGAANRNITHKNIYRTATAATGTADFYFVAQIPVGNATYGDVLTDLQVAQLGRNLESTLWFEPPANMDGIVSFPGGILLGWKDNTVFMSEPYRPHAWVEIYQVSVEQTIVGIGVTGNTAVVATMGPPVAITMTTPATASMQKIEAPEPCLSRGSIVGTTEGVFYASQNGLMLFGPTGFANASKGLLTKEDWLGQFNPTTMRACRYQTEYIGITQPGTGYVIHADDATMNLTELTDLSGAQNIQNDIWSGEVYLIANGVVFKWDDALQPEAQWRWATKRFLFPYEINIGAARVTAKPHHYDTLVAKPDAEPWAVATPDGTGSNGAPANVIPITPTWAAFVVKVYRDGKLVFERRVRDNKTFRLPSGYKSCDWQFEILARRPLAKFEFAETAKELAAV